MESYILANDAPNGVVLLGGSPVFANCRTEFHGGDGIYISDTTDAVIRGNLIRGNGSIGIQAWSEQGQILIENNYIPWNIADGIWLLDCPAEIRNNLIYTNGLGISVFYSVSDVEIVGNTIAHNYGNGVSLTESNANLVNNIVAFNGGHGLNADTNSSLTGSYNCIYGNASGDLFGSITLGITVFDDPLFVRDTAGNPYFLSHVATGQPSDSPCVNEGDSAIFPVIADQNFTTRTDFVDDSGIIDIGFHYFKRPDETLPDPYPTPTPTPPATGTPTAPPLPTPTPTPRTEHYVDGRQAINGDGTEGFPWNSIAFATDNIFGTADYQMSINVFPTTYLESISLGEYESLYVWPDQLNPDAIPLIDGNVSNGVYMTSHTRIDGFEVDGDYAIYATGGDVLITHCIGKGVIRTEGTVVFRENHFDHMVFCLGGTPLIEDNTTEFHGGIGFYLSGTTNAILRRNYIRGNDSIGIQAYPDNGIMTIQDNYICWNLADGIWLYSCPASIVNNLIYTNGLGIGIWDTDNVEISGNTIAYNLSDGITLNNSNAYLTNNIIAFNSSYGINADIDSSAIVEYSCFYGNPSGAYNGPVTADQNVIYSDPLFANDSLGNPLFLSQTAAGQASNSLCVDNGDPLLIPSGTTRTDHQGDIDPVDIGFHYYEQPDPALPAP